MPYTPADMHEIIVPATILVVEKTTDPLQPAGRILEEAGYSVLLGDSAAQALSLTSLYRPDLLLLDDELADGSAEELVACITSDPQLAGVFVVLMTSQRQRYGALAAGRRSGGPDAFLVRPCQGIEFLDRVGEYLSLRGARDRLRESERRYRTLFLGTEKGIALLEIISSESGIPYDCRFLEVNPAFEQLVGRPASSLVGHSVPEVLPGSAGLWAHAYGQVALSGQTVLLEECQAIGERTCQIEIHAPQPGRLSCIFIDVTQRQALEERLAATDERCRALLSAFDGSIYTCSEDYRITYMNDELIGRRGDAVGSYCYQALHGLEEVCPWCVNERVFQGERVAWEVKSPKDGRWYHCINTPVYHADGSISKQALIRDITHLKKTEAELSFKSFTLENLGAEVFWLSSEGRIMDLNRVACEKLGYAREELVGRPITEIDPEFDHEEPRRLWSELKERGTRQFETTHQTRDGRRYPVEVLANYLNLEGLEFNCCIVRDISERKRLERALQDGNELFRTLCDSAPIGIFRCDAQWNNIYCNARWEEITGMFAIQGAGNGWLTAIHPEDREELLRVRNEAAAKGQGYWHEHRKLTSQGKVVWVRVLVNPIKDPQGGIVGYVGTVEDITELRQARQEILKSQKLESIGVLAGGIAHDFNNILTAVLGNISLAGFQLDDPQKVAQRLEEAESAAARARDLTQQLLTFARGGEPVKKMIELPGLLKEAVAFALHGSLAGCQLQLAEDLWPLEAAEGQLVQVVHNLVLNAVQAMPEGGMVTVAAENHRTPGGDPFVQISVSDTGIGISDQHLERIFDPYFTTKKQGSGLGLASCYSIIKRHLGTITAQSLLGKGSTFRVLLPASREVVVPAGSSVAEVSGGASRVLVMDDEEIVRTLAKAILEQLGYRAECVENGTQAAELYRRERESGEPFSAVILDLTVPGGVGGKEAIKMLRSYDPQVKAIVCSGYSTDPVMANFREHGFNAVLAKPYRPHDLSRVLREVLG
ncbi:hypothetical protein GMST_07560 [Geomonas silvestris]|uniref:histidine kinase n=1 Tax=Geomonas silvestris TaxID=2740184 RepID=A0A6V8MEK4_9BACT|nr:PAS domain S-box protein [Geomonas silvestris]GFO58431.1 hypothetical protein GMST_07560 [Geomonas silvestris]